ncbi:hypothetical protein NEIMUCOT_03545 [Neisseria mucosa ATCC 25996]|uniref:Uncharacterized protein n=1 Tax=Neisseria mucosa (strain ATCC 25996 / DSM 4631 / NCTC 10774 / M26) TaxID=546266 RepID=D2ZSG3_NEIM2|nr:hypothetical protein NEIMUCOT_03545 [Neisseria mucosa ATCC 25996]
MPIIVYRGKGIQNPCNRLERRFYGRLKYSGLTKIRTRRRSRRQYR